MADVGTKCLWGACWGGAFEIARKLRLLRAGFRGESAESVGRRRFRRHAPQNPAPETPFPARVPAASKGRGPLGAARGLRFGDQVRGTARTRGRSQAEAWTTLHSCRIRSDLLAKHRLDPHPGTSWSGSSTWRSGRVLHSRTAIARLLLRPLPRGRLIGMPKYFYLPGKGKAQAELLVELEDGRGAPGLTRRARERTRGMVFNVRLVFLAGIEPDFGGESVRAAACQRAMAIQL
jgi:hypothetical protein